MATVKQHEDDYVHISKARIHKLVMACAWLSAWGFVTYITFVALMNPAAEALRVACFVLIGITLGCILVIPIVGVILLSLVMEGLKWIR